MIENDGDKCYASESKLVSYNCNISHEIQTEKNKRLFSRSDEPNFYFKMVTVNLLKEIILSIVRIVFHHSLLLVHVVNYGG